MIKRSVVCLLFCAAALSSTVRLAKATPIYDYTIDSPIPEYVTGSTSPVQSQQTLVTTSYNYNNVVPVEGHAAANAAAGYGFLRGSSKAGVSQTGLTGYPPTGLPKSAQEGSDFNIDNIQLIAPSGTNQNTVVYYSLNLALSGGVDAFATTGYSALASAQIYYGTSSSLGGFGGNLLGSISEGSVNGFTTSGLFQGWASGTSNSAVGTSPVHTARAGDTISVSLSLDTAAQVGYTVFQGEPAGSATALADFSHTAMFLTDGPLFNFFDQNGDTLTGWTAASTDGCIVDNKYTCAPLASVNTVPEPGTTTLFGLGIGLLVSTRLRRKPNSSMQLPHDMENANCHAAILYNSGCQSSRPS